MEAREPVILWPDQFGDPDLARRAGGKSSALAALSDALPIPPWFAVLPEAARSDVEAAAGELAGDLFAVRSSACGEDGAEHSFAGQLESYLNVGRQEIWNRVEAVRASGNTPRVLAYRKEHNLPLPTPVPAVVVQRMVAARAAGVAFSADPVSGRRGTVVVAAVRGLGDALVSGEASAETWHVDRSNQACKVESAGEPVLQNERVLDVAKLARASERHFGRPQDIEWAIDDTGLWLLQSRPITTLAGVADPDGVTQLWDNSNIAESYGGITLPLTFSFARRAYEEVYRVFCLIVGVDERTVAASGNLFRHMLGMVRGRVYYNLLNWYRVLALLPGFRTNRRFMETMMGVKEGLPADVVEQISAGSRLGDTLRLARSVAGLAGSHRNLERSTAAFYVRLEKALGSRPPDLASYRADELVSHYRSLESQLLTRWDAPLVNDFFAMIYYGVLRQLCVKWCGDEAGTLQNDLLAARGGIISAEPARRVRAMAGMCAGTPELIETLRSGSLREIRRAIRSHRELATALEEYIEKFGDRCLEELKLESTTLRDDPLLLMRSIAALAVNLNGAAEADLEALARNAEEAAFRRIGANPVRRILFGWVLKNARLRVSNRENLRFERTRVFGRVRLIFLELGKRLAAVGKLAEPRDVFYLEVEELLGYVEGTTSCTDLAGLAAVRKANYEEFRRGPVPPDRFETRGGVHDAMAAGAGSSVAGSEQRWKGTGACPGIVQGRVRVVRDPAHARLEQGEVLVAERTDPGWVLLFPIAAGLLVERGSLLSHSAIVARELRLPAIVGLAGITDALCDGDLVEMNGATGEVRRLDADAV